MIPAPFVRAIVQFMLLITFTCGCSPNLEGQLEFVARDSAGVRIIEYGDIRMAVDKLRIGDEPVYRIGWEPEDREWGQVIAAALMSGGRAAIGDRLTNEVVVLGVDGTIEAVVGGPGQGPGELQSIWGVVTVGLDTIVVQTGSGRISLFHSGALVRSLPSQRVLPWRRAESTDGKGGLLLGGIPELYRPNYYGPWLQLAVHRLDLETGVAEPIAMVDFAQNPGIAAGNPFSALGHSTASEGGFVIGRGSEPQILWFDLAGDTTQILRWIAAEEPVTDAVWQAYESEFRVHWTGDPDDLEAELGVRRAAARRPLPVFEGLKADSEGNVWIANFNPAFRRPSTRFHVVTATGEWLGAVGVPSGFEVLDIDSNYVLGIERDALGVEAVTLYRLER